MKNIVLTWGSKDAPFLPRSSSTPALISGEILRASKFVISSLMPRLARKLKNKKTKYNCLEYKWTWKTRGSNPNRVVCLWVFSKSSDKYWVYSANNTSVYMCKTKMSIRYPRMNMKGRWFQSHPSNMPVIFLTELGKALSIQCSHTPVYIGKAKMNIRYPQCKFPSINEHVSIKEWWNGNVDRWLIWQFLTNTGF